MERGKTFVMSYSCGKDSTLALHKMLAAGHTPLALLVMFNPEAGRSYFHGADHALLARYAEALQIPLLPVDTAGETYHLSMEAALREAVVERYPRESFQAYYPLWQRGREENVREVLALGYRCVIKSLNNTLLPRSLLGRVLDEDVLAEMERCGIDLCGENGEYHTLVVDGPVFHKQVTYQTGKILDFGEYSLCDIF